MKPNSLFSLRAMAMAAGLAAAVAAAAPVLSTEYRYASQISEYFVRGDAAVSESTVLKRGLRLAAWDAPDEQQATRVAVATAAYFFQVPAAARAVTIEVGYQRDQAADSRDIAGFLFVRNKAVEEQFADQNQDGQRPVEEPGFFGSTYFLPSKDTRVSITLPAENHVVNDVLEVHVSAGAGQVLDVLYVQVTALGGEVPVQVAAAETPQYLADPYQYTYFYYYGGPSYYAYPGGYYAPCTVFAVDPIYWWGWYSRRACYHHNHHWAHRPSHYQHHPPVVCRQALLAYYPRIATYRGDWFRRHFDVDTRQVGERDLDRLARRRVERLTPERAIEQRRNSQVVAESIQRFEGDLRTRLADRFHGQVAAWRRNPAQAARDVASGQHSPVIQQASANWGAARTGRRPELIGGTPSRQTAPSLPTATRTGGPRVIPTPTAPPAVERPQPPQSTLPRPPRQGDNRQDDTPRPRRDRDDAPRPKAQDPVVPLPKAEQPTAPAPRASSWAPPAPPRREVVLPPAPRAVERPTRPSDGAPVVRAPRVVERPAPAPAPRPEPVQVPAPRIVERPARFRDSAPSEAPRVVERPAPAPAPRPEPVQVPAPRIVERPARFRDSAPVEVPRVVERPAPAPAPRIIERAAPPRQAPSQPDTAPTPAPTPQRPQYNTTPAPVYTSPERTERPTERERASGRGRR